MPSQCSHFVHILALPDIDGIHGVPMRGYKFVGVNRVHHIAYLWTCIDFLQAPVLIDIPHPDRFISGATPSRQYVVLVWGPSQCLDCRRVLIKFMHHLTGSHIVDANQVVITTRSYHIAVEWPFHSTDLLFMRLPFAGDFSGSDIPNQHSTIFRSTGNQVVVAIHSPDSATMVAVFARLSFFLDVDHA